MGVADFTQSIAVVNKSGKVVSTSKHLLNVFKEAKSAYRERKAEISASKGSQREVKRSHQSGRVYTIEDDERILVEPSSRHQPHQRTSSIRRKPVERRSSSRSEASYASRRSHHASSERPPSAFVAPEMTRRHTTRDISTALSRTPSPTPPQRLLRSQSTPGPIENPLAYGPLQTVRRSSIDMSLAYGELPPELPARHPDEDMELSTLVTKVRSLLEEADCLHYSAVATIANLQKNPEAMAAVGLALAEISNLVSKMAPSVLIGIRNSAPAVFALLASPQFLIAAGVGVGITVVALGGYKIIKKIKANKAAEDLLQGQDEMLEISEDVSHIEQWRRGIPAYHDIDRDTISVEGEFITPQAAALSRLNLNETAEGNNRRARLEDAPSSSRASRLGRSSSSKAGSSSKSEKGEKNGEKRKKRKSSGLRNMLRSL
ncbi:hypothetical protein MMC25_003361 [Agyrium rufum]|nr:hypothetical protein [Agyrium rufum]